MENSILQKIFTSIKKLSDQIHSRTLVGTRSGAKSSQMRHRERFPIADGKSLRRKPYEHRKNETSLQAAQQISRTRYAQ